MKALVQWNPLEPSNPHKCLNVSDDLAFSDLPENERLAFWDSIYEDVRSKLY